MFSWGVFETLINIMSVTTNQSINKGLIQKSLQQLAHIIGPFKFGLLKQAAFTILTLSILLKLLIIVVVNAVIDFRLQQANRTLEFASMTLSQSKLMLQLSKEQKISHRSPFSEEYIEEIYSTICKLEPKNLMLVEFLSLVIEKEFIRNSNKIMEFVELYEQVRGKNLDQEHGYNKNSLEVEQQKFNKKKFIKLLKEMSKRLYPGHTNPYETIMFEKLQRSYNEDHKMRLDQSIKKMLSKDTLVTLHQFDREFQFIFQIYMPQNYNNSLEFGWDEIKALQKKLPIICFLRFLFEADVVPHSVTPTLFLQIISKLKPPSVPNSSSSKEAMFYTSETLTAYCRDHIHLPAIKLLEGDVGLSFLQMQILFVKLAVEFCKDTKGEFPISIKKLASFIKIKQAFEQNYPRKNKFMEIVKNYMKTKNVTNDKVILKKRESKRKIEDLYDCKQTEFRQESAKNLYKNMTVELRQMELIKRDLDNQLPEAPRKKKLEKENSGYFDVQKKHIVIGEQLPKIQDKNKPTNQKDSKKKNQDQLLGFKPQPEKQIEESDIAKILKRPKKMRVNTEYPIILNEVFYPSDLKSQLFIGPKAELYLQTSYIHLGERLYEQAFLNYVKAKQFTQSKSGITQFYYHIHAAQIFQSAGKDELSLSFYHKAKQLLGVLTSIEGEVRSHPYIGMGACLYHMQEYEYAMRCFEKAKNLYGTNLCVQSLQNAILHNNIGCCLMMLNRNQEAIKYFQTSHHILDLKVGCFDQRTLVVQQNFNKNRKAYLEMLPQFKTMWKTYVLKSPNKLPTVKPTPTKQKK